MVSRQLVLSMYRRARRSAPTLVIALLALLALSGCRDATGADEPRRCRQMYGYGNDGCARVVLLVEPPPPPFPSSKEYFVKLRAARVTADGITDAGPAHSGPGANEVEYPLTAGTGTMDTLSVWAIARLSDLGPAPEREDRVFAADSALVLLRFTPVGERPAVDTVRLTLQPP